MYRDSQANLSAELGYTSDDLDKIFEGEDAMPTDLQKYTDKIAEMKHQMTVIDNVLQSAHVSSPQSNLNIHNVKMSEFSF